MHRKIHKTQSQSVTSLLQAEGVGYCVTVVHRGAMTRFVVCLDNLYVTAVYDRTSSGIGLTPNREDAGSWVTYERAVEAARIVAESLGTFASVHSVTEPNYPKSWTLAAD